MEYHSAAYIGSYIQRTSQRRWRVIGCTCEGRGACRATCRMPVPE